MSLVDKQESCSSTEFVERVDTIRVDAKRGLLDSQRALIARKSRGEVEGALQRTTQLGGARASSSRFRQPSNQNTCRGTEDSGQFSPNSQGMLTVCKF